MTGFSLANMVRIYLDGMDKLDVLTPLRIIVLSNS